MAAANPDHRRRPDREVTAAHQALADRTAFAELYLLTLAPVTRYVTVRMREVDPHAVPDLVHDAYCAALADPGRLHDDALGGLLRLAAKACTDHERSRRRVIRAAYALHAHQQATTTPTSPPRPRADSARLAHLLGRLDADQRQVLHLRYLDGCTRAETAAALGRTIGSVRHLERRALMSLHADLTQPGTVASPPASTGAARHAHATA